VPHLHHAKSLVAGIAILAVTAGVATAHMLPDAATFGITTATAASGQQVPLWHMPEGTAPTNPGQQPDVSGQPTDNHGATVSDAAKNPTPSDGDWANHGAYVSSIAKGWGTQTAADHQSPQGASASADGQAHRP
jgi:hypothetical protein